VVSWILGAHVKAQACTGRKAAPTAFVVVVAGDPRHVPVPSGNQRRGCRASKILSYFCTILLFNATSGQHGGSVPARCTLAGTRTFLEVGDQAADLPQEVLRALGGRVHLLRRRVIAPSETRIRTLVHAVSAEALDEVLGRWLLTAIDGKWLRGVADGQVKLFAAMLQRRR
jgi:hypothetical protein